MTTICLHCTISGHVQGVFYRREAAEQAKSRNLTGWVKNLADGRVEIMICGDEKAVLEMQEWLWEGPEAAKVQNVEAETLPHQEYSNFEVRY